MYRYYVWVNGLLVEETRPTHAHTHTHTLVKLWESGRTQTHANNRALQQLWCCSLPVDDTQIWKQEESTSTRSFVEPRMYERGYWLNQNGTFANTHTHSQLYIGGGHTYSKQICTKHSSIAIYIYLYICEIFICIQQNPTKPEVILLKTRVETLTQCARCFVFAWCI